MCEFNVILNGETLFKDVVYVKAEDNNIIVRNVLGEAKAIQNCQIIEVDVNSARLVLKALE
jgi:predicted RNA-binding protein